MATVQSIQTNSVTTNDSITITKPVSLASGDLMIAAIVSYDGANPAMPADKSGWTTVETVSVGSPAANCKVYSKIADAGDVAASDFTFTCDGSGSDSMDNLRGGIYRITSSTTATVRSADSATASSSSTPAFTVSAVNITGSIVIGIVVNDDGVTVSGYTINGTNPTWTERYDQVSASLGLAIADAVTPDSTTITSFSATLSLASASGGIVLVVTDQASAAGTTALLSADADFFAPTATSGTTGTNALLEASPTFPEPDADGTVPTAWTLTQKS